MAIEIKKHIAGIKYEDVSVRPAAVDGGSKDPAYRTIAADKLVLNPSRKTVLASVRHPGSPKPALALPRGVAPQCTPVGSNLTVSFPAGLTVSFPPNTGVAYLPGGAIQLNFGDGLEVSFPPANGAPPFQIELNPGETVTLPGQSGSSGLTVTIPNSPSGQVTVSFPEPTTVTFPPKRVPFNCAARLPVAPNAR